MTPGYDEFCQIIESLACGFGRANQFLKTGLGASRLVLVDDVLGTSPIQLLRSYAEFLIRSIKVSRLHSFTHFS